MLPAAYFYGNIVATLGSKPVTLCICCIPKNTPKNTAKKFAKARFK